MRTLMAMTPMISPASSTKHKPIVDTAIRALLREDLLAGGLSSFHQRLSLTLTAKWRCVRVRAVHRCV